MFSLHLPFRLQIAICAMEKLLIQSVVKWFKWHRGVATEYRKMFSPV